MRKSFRLTLLAIVALLSAVRHARADDWADEAEFLFQRGADAYQRGNYEDALERFLASNRLVRNRNVLYNIARTYERLKRYPEAYRYFLEAKESEPDIRQQQRIDAALDVIGRHVAVLRVETKPAAATLYVNRRDLGALGTSPRVFGFTPGAYTIIAELPGYHPAEVAVPLTLAGEQRQVTLELRAITGHLRVEGPPDLEVHRRSDSTAPECMAPCSLEFVPGQEELWFRRPGYRTLQKTALVQADQTVILRPSLEPLQSHLIVTTDDPGARLELDGRTIGFTPTVAAVPVGRHRLRLSRSGFLPVERSVTIAPNQEQSISVVMTQEEQVTAASRVEQPVAEAPSSVSIITGDEIRAFRYPTVAQALRGVPGVYTWDDRSYVSVGIRGIGLLGSYGNRVLVLSDGHPLNDDWVGSSYVGYEGRVDLADLERIEVVRGPGSEVYGTGAFSGVINLVTRPSGRTPRLEFGLGTEGDGVARARARVQTPFGRKGSLWASVSAAHGSGRDYFFPEFAGAGSDSGYARGVDDFDAATLEGRLTQGVVTAQWFWTIHDKAYPSAAYRTLLGDDRARQQDSRAALEIRAEPRLSSTIAWLSRAHVNYYRFRGAYPRLPADRGLWVDTFKGAWAGLEQRLQLEPAPELRVFVGGEMQSHFSVEQLGVTDRSVVNDTTGHSHPFWVGAAYATVDATPHPRLTVHAGVRLDAYSTFGSSLNPRFAAIFKPYAGGNLKLLAGKAFRAPSVYELYYNDGGLTQRASTELGPEQVYSGELEFSHQLTPLLSATATAFGNYVSDLVISEGTDRSDNPLHYVNSSVPLATAGAELGFRRDWRQGMLLSASYGLIVARYLENKSFTALLQMERDRQSRQVANVPTHLFTAKGVVPLLGTALRLASRLSIESGRYDRFEAVGEDPQSHTRAVALWDLVLSGVLVPAVADNFQLDWALGVYNAFDARYALPVSHEFVQRTMPQSGRTLLLSAESSL